MCGCGCEAAAAVMIARQQIADEQAAADTQKFAAGSARVSPVAPNQSLMHALLQWWRQIGTGQAEAQPVKFAPGP